MNRNILLSIRLAALCVLALLQACGGDSGGEAPPPQPPATFDLIGAAGGTVTGPNGAAVQIPAGALQANVNVQIAQTAVGAPALPAALIAQGLMFAFTPHGTTFAMPVTMTMPFDPAGVPAGATPQLYKTNAQNEWEQVANAQAVALQADGKIVVAGSTKNTNTNFTNFAIALFNSDCTLDANFGNGFGFLMLDFFGGTDSAERVLVQPDGKILLGGLAENNQGRGGYGLARFSP